MTDECPKPLINGDSMRWIELFRVWRRSFGVDLTTWPAKDADAMGLLTECLAEWKEEEHGRSERSF